MVLGWLRSIHLQEPVPQHHWTIPDRPYRPVPGELGSCGLGAGELGRAGASWTELGRAGASWGDLGAIWGRSRASWGEPGRAGPSWGDLERARSTWAKPGRAGSDPGRAGTIQGARNQGTLHLHTHRECPPGQLPMNRPRRPLCYILVNFREQHDPGVIRSNLGACLVLVGCGTRDWMVSAVRYCNYGILCGGVLWTAPDRSPHSPHSPQ